MTKPLHLISQGDISTVVAEYIPSNNKETLYQSEEALEKEMIKTLENQGYEYIKINSLEDLKLNLRKQIQSLNNYEFTNNEWSRFYSKFIANSKESIVEKTKKIQEDCIYTLTLDNNINRNIKLIDKKNIHNNKLQVINQYKVEGQYKNRYDVTILVNGLPLVHIELKRRGVAIKEAFNQIKRYEKESFWAGDGLFEYVQIYVISNGTQSKYYSNSTRHTKLNGKKNTFEFTSYWADVKNREILDLIDFTKTFFAKHTILNILTKYCVFTSNENLLVMRPYQIAATEKILEKINIVHNQKKYGQVANGGYIWHTTGSGKTLTSFKTSVLLNSLDYIYKVLFIVDRKDLDYQTMKEYDKFQKDCANSNSNTNVLSRQLEDPNPDAKIIITTIQKLDRFIKSNKKHKVFEEEVVMIFDECHRSQLGSMHKNITDNFKKFYLFGFTGTPIFAENCDISTPKSTTEEKFGPALHKYTIIDATKDGNVLPFRVSYHNTLKAKEHIKDKEVKAIDTEKALLDSRRIKNIVEYILENFAHITKHDDNYTFKKLDNVEAVAANFKNAKEKRSEVTIKGFNSIFACAGIEAVKKYYQAFKSKDHNLKIAAIFSYSPNEDFDGLTDENNESIENLDKSSREFLEDIIKDYNKMFACQYDTSDKGFQNYYKDVSLRMKNKEIDILIVANMFLTGFDAVTLNTLWVDKNLKYHGLVQAFSRTNRIFNSVKTFGNIICFRDLEDNLNKALALFGNKDAGGIVLLKSYKDYYYGYIDNGKEYKGYMELINNLLESYPIGELTISEEAKKQFIKLYGDILKLRNILSYFDEFKNDNLISQRQLQDYQGMYLDLYNELRSIRQEKKEDVSDDLIFEIELIKQVEVNIDYILTLITKYAKEKNEEKQGILKTDIESKINSSTELRNKKELILSFIEKINVQSDNIEKDFQEYVTKKRDEEFKELLIKYKLKEDESYAFMEKSFEYGKISFKGTEIAKLLPKENSSFFNKSANREETKEKVSNAFLLFFEKFYNISSSMFRRKQEDNKLVN